MRNAAAIFETLISERGLHCVWVRAGDQKGAPLVARWIGPRTPVEAQWENENGCETVFHCEDDEGAGGVRVRTQVKHLGRKLGLVEQIAGQPPLEPCVSTIRWAIALGSQEVPESVADRPNE